VTEHFGDLEGSVAVLAEKGEEGIAADEVGLRGFERLGGDFVRLFGKRAGKADDFAGVGNAEDDRRRRTIGMWRSQ
jgi:hypothetical protein